MTADQLQHARLRSFHQDNRPVLTADDAGAWLREAGLALLRPRGRELPAPAPTLAEAVGGRAEAAPGAPALAEAMRLVVRLQAEGVGVPLRLLPGAPVGDEPDYLATGETLPFVYALRGDREWARGPRGKTSPLSGEVWKLLGAAGEALTAGEIKDRLGRQLTETAALRALGELWAALRVEPVYAEAGETRWRRMEAGHRAAMDAGAAMGQATALSALVSLYLQAAVAASGDELEAWLGPLASRSRVRDTVRGLVATRQVGVRAVAAEERFFVEGSLPDFAPEFPAAAHAAPGARSENAAAPVEAEREVVELAAGVETGAATEAEPVVIEGEEGGRFRIEPVPETDARREAFGPGFGPGEGLRRFTAARGTGAAPPRREFGGAPQRREFGGAAASFPGGKKPFFARQPWREDRPGQGGRPETGAGAPSETGFGPKSGSGSGQGAGGTFRGGRPAGEPRGASFGARPADGRSFSARPAPGGNARGGAAAGAGKPAGKAFAGRAFPGKEPGRGYAKPQGARPEGGQSERPGGRGSGPGGASRETAGRRPFAPREERSVAGEGDRRPFAPREERSVAGEGDRRPFAPREGKPFRPETGGRRFESGGPKPFGGGAKAFGTKPKPFGGAPGRFTRADQTGPTQPGAAPFPSQRPARAGGGQGGFDRPKRTFGGGGNHGPAGGGKPFAPRGEGAAAGDRPARSFAGDRGKQNDRDDRGNRGDRKPFGAARPFRAEGSAGAPRRMGAPDPRSNESGDAGARRGGFRPESSGGGSGAGFRAGAGAGRPRGKKPRTAPFTSSGKPRAGVAKPGRPGPKAGRPGTGAGPRKPFGKGPKRDG